jgi:hypothetical protein
MGASQLLLSSLQLGADVLIERLLLADLVVDTASLGEKDGH